MLKTFTPNDLIKFYYKETSTEDALMIKNALVEDSELKEEYLEMRQLMRFLNTESNMQPSQSSIDIILNHSRSTKCN